MQGDILWADLWLVIDYLPALIGLLTLLTTLVIVLALIVFRA